MELGRFYIEVSDGKILEILSHITNDEIKFIRQICERYGTGEDDVRYYNVYSIETSSGSKLLKMTDEREVFNYERYLSGRGFAVPFYYGKWMEKDSIWILIENVPGDDLRNMTDELAVLTADSLAQIQNYFWQQDEEEFLLKKTDDRFEVYWKRILRRAASVAENPGLRKAYQLFLNRQLTCPRTLSNGDFLEYNVVQTKDKVTIIDWGFGGVMPYSLDIARFIAHATETRSTFPFYMNARQKELFINRVYEKLERKPNYEQYLCDIKLAVLNEYVEFVEAEEDEDKWYYNHALQLAEDLSAEMKKYEKTG